MKILPCISIIFLLAISACKEQQINNPIKEVISNPLPKTWEAPDWTKDANIYEVNVRQYTPEGTLKAFQEHLPRLKAMGVDILWLMPIHPIGEIKRKGGLGSPYSVQNYTGVNPDFGTLEDFKELVKEVHKQDMFIILDWVANHSAWDNAWLNEHPDWYTYDNDTITHPLDPNSGNPTGWTDVADLNYENADMRDAMTDALKYWITETDIDGYRCDVAGFVPYEFWDSLRPQLQQIKDVFMLAEWEDPKHHENNAFDMSYGWELHHLMNDIAKGNKAASELNDYFDREKNKFSSEAYRMYFTSNHDENSWNGSEYERMGDAAKTFAVFATTVNSMPLIYSGQESALEKRLEFFEKDQIDWKDFPLQDFYKTLLNMKKGNKALWNGKHGGTMQVFPKDEKVFAFKREKDGNQVLVILNLSKQKTSYTSPEAFSEMKNVFTGENQSIQANEKLQLRPWEYLILSKNN